MDEEAPEPTREPPAPQVGDGESQWLTFTAFEVADPNLTHFHRALLATERRRQTTTEQLLTSMVQAARLDGVLAVAVRLPAGATHPALPLVSHSGPTLELIEACKSAATILSLSGRSLLKARLSARGAALVVYGDAQASACLAIAVGHPIRKSAHRTVKRLLKWAAKVGVANYH